MEQMVNDYFLGAARIAKEMTAWSPRIGNIVDLIVERLKDGKKILVCGNGGSAAQSSHLVGELVGRFERDRDGVPCISLSSDTAFNTAWANDYEYDSLFERGVSTYGAPGDVLIAITTSGNSNNVIRALKKAGGLGITTVALLGKDGGEVKKRELADHSIVVPHDNTAHIQEVHLMIIHIFCRLIEKRLFPDE